MRYVEDDFRMFASERSHGVRINVRREQITCMNSENILMVDDRNVRSRLSVSIFWMVLLIFPIVIPSF